jgi:YafQ family addiction module toxin component
MPIQYDFSDELKEALEKLFKKDRTTYQALMKKITEITSREAHELEYYKNMRYELSDYKRAHIAKSFVLLFKVDKKNNFILFDRFDHHDNIY